jgi:hypothetical protein
MANPRLLSDQAFAAAAGLPGPAAVLAKLCLEHPVHPTAALLKEVEFDYEREAWWGDEESDEDDELDDDDDSVGQEGPTPTYPARRACDRCHRYPPGYYRWPPELPDPPPFEHESWGRGGLWRRGKYIGGGEDMVCYACVQAEARRRGYTMEPHEELGGGILMLNPRTGRGTSVEEKPYTLSELKECLESCLSCPVCDPPSDEARDTPCYRCEERAEWRYLIA